MEKIGIAKLYNQDSLSLVGSMAGEFDLLLTDPPYGIGESMGKNKSRGKLARARDYGVKSWDNKPADKKLLDLCLKTSTSQIIFGGNYFDLPPSRCWLVWDKQNGNSDFADCELAWTNLDKAVRIFRYRWSGFLQGNMSKKEIRYHPTQKPVPLLKWCLSHVPGITTVIDPFMGSGSTGVAAVELGINFVGIEVDTEYFDVSCMRIEKAQVQKRLF